MPGYIVRLRERQEIVGFFCVQNYRVLYEAVDECCDPFACEFAIVYGGGFYFPSRVDFTVPHPASLEDEGDVPEIPQPTLNENLWMAFYFGEQMEHPLKWRVFDPADIFNAGEEGLEVM